MKKLARSITAVLSICAFLFCFVACGANMNGTYKYDYVAETVYGDTVLQIPTYMELTIDGDNYDMIMTVDIGGGFAMCLGYSGKCTVNGDTVTCKLPDKHYSYEATIEDGAAVVDKGTKTESEPQAGLELAETSYTLVKDAGTFKPVA